MQQFRALDWGFADETQSEMQGVRCGPANRQIPAGKIVEQMPEMVDGRSRQRRGDEKPRSFGLWFGAYGFWIRHGPGAFCHGESIGGDGPVDSATVVVILFV